MIVLSRSYLAVLCAVLTGCAGGGSSPMSSLPSGSGMAQRGAPQDQRGCQNDGGGLAVVPCSITFNSGNPGPVQVSVLRNTDGNRNGGGRIREQDNCASKGIATIARDSKGIYTVTAGSMQGSCDARFSVSGRRGGNHDGDRGGNGDLHITNEL